MKNLKLFSILLFVVAIIAVGCGKGTTGPAGPQGPAGPDSVIYGPWTQINLVFNPNDDAYEQDLYAPGITQTVLDSGIILTYIGIPNGITVSEVLPASPYVQELYVLDSIYLSSDTTFVNGLDYRYVVVPGAVSDGQMVSGPAKGMTKEQLQTMSYQAAMKMFGIPAKPYGQ
jgi:hypothetical protein